MRRDEKIREFMKCCENYDYCDNCLLSRFGNSPCHAPYAMTDKELEIALLLVKGDCDFTELVKACETMEWTSVKDHLPEEEGWYLVAIHHDDGYSSTTDYLTIDQSEEPPRKTWCWHQDSVTHWVETTDPPKEEGVNA